MDNNKPMTFDLVKGLSWGAVIEINPNRHPFDVTIWQAKSKDTGASIELIQNIRNELIIKITNQHGNSYFSKATPPELYFDKAIYFGFSIQFVSENNLIIKTFINAKLSSTQEITAKFDGLIKNSTVRIGSNIDNPNREASFVLGELFMFERADDILMDESLWKYIDDKWAVSTGIKSEAVKK